MVTEVQLGVVATLCGLFGYYLGYVTTIAKVHDLIGEAVDALIRQVVIPTENENNKMFQEIRDLKKELKTK